MNVALSQNKRRLRDVLCLTFSDSVLREGVKKNKKSGEPKKKRASLLSEGEVNTKTCTGYTMLMRVDIAERACGKCIDPVADVLAHLPVHLRAGLPPFPGGDRLVMWTIPAVIDWFFTAK